MKFIIVTLLFLSLAFSAGAQLILLRGNLSDSSGQGISDADVFVNNTSVHTVSDARGNFVLAGVPANIPFDIIVSRTGYKTFSKSFAPATAFDFQKIKLLPTQTLNDVTVTSEYESWRKWKNIFIGTFIGTGEFAADCKILNPEVLKITFDKNTNTLHIHSSKPLQIRNNALGYLVSYQIVRYEYDTSRYVLSFFGYPFFQELNGKNKAKKRWRENRKIAYKGSCMQFMREVYTDSLKEDFTMLNPKTRKIFLPYKEWKERMAAQHFNISMKNPPDSMPIIVHDTLFVKDIVYTKDGVKYFNSNDSVMVISNKISEEEIALKTRPQLFSKGYGSLFSLGNNVIVSVWKDGSFSNPDKFMLQGLWAFTEKISTLLPLDYIEKE